MRDDLIVRFVCEEVDRAVNSNTTLSKGAAELHLQLFQGSHEVPADCIPDDRWAFELIDRDDVWGRKMLQLIIDWFEENDGKADDFGEKFIVKDARHALANYKPRPEPKPFTPMDEARTCVPHGRRDCEECYDAAIDHEMGMTEKPGVWNEHGVMGSEGVFHGKEGGAYQLPECDASEEVIEAVTSAIIKMNALPGPKLTHFMARQRAKAAINEMQDVIRSPDLMWPETINVKMGDNEFVCERLSNGVYEMPTGQIFIRMTPEDHVIKVANGQRLVNCPCGQPHPIADENLSMTCGYCNRHLVLDRSEPGRRPDFADYAEPFCSGWIARRENPDVKDDDGQAFSRLLMEAFNNSGSQRAKRMRTSDAMEELSRRFGTKLGQ